MEKPSDVTTGITALDELLRGIEPGDNIVWQVECTEDYHFFARAFAEQAIAHGRRTVYIRFGRHEPLLVAQEGLTLLEVDPEAGFEPFIDAIHSEIVTAGRGAFYVFDCLSDLLADWYSDQMLGNFFMLTCPFLFDMDTVAYFSLLRNHHGEAAIGPIRNTTQLLIDLYRHDGRIYLRPIKVRQRAIPTMHHLHILENDRYEAVTESHVLAEVLGRTTQMPARAPFRLDLWNRTFLEAQDGPERRFSATDTEKSQLLSRLLRMAVSRDERVLALAERYFTLDDVAAIGRRIVGTGLIGGKAVGMLLAQAILRRTEGPWKTRLETHDSFYIASDVFYTFLVENGCWWIRKKQRNLDTIEESASEARRRILTGTFSPPMVERFREMLEYFGRSPIIVRSSSLLEDNFGNAFAGKYESVFCANQGSPDQRLDEFLDAVKTVYASSMGEEALAYRARHNLLQLDEQMALLVQRVSGSRHGRFFYPHLAGVGFSFNPYVWTRDIDPQAGLVRLVFGLGTRAVDRSDDDYTRIIALNAPELRPEGDARNETPYAQHKVDVIDLRENALRTIDFDEAIAQDQHLPLDRVAPVSAATARRDRQIRDPRHPPRFLTFDGVVRDTELIGDMRAMLAVLEGAYQYPVDVEFAIHLLPDDSYRLNLLQCRPLQIQANSLAESRPQSLSSDRILLQSRGPLIGRSRSERVRRLIYVIPEKYAALRMQDRYAVARLIGQLAHLPPVGGEHGSLMLVGPGRWGTRSPELGVPVTFAEINTVDILCEIVAMRKDLTPDVSMGTHFFSELVESDMLYIALFPGNEENRIDFSNLPGAESITLGLESQDTPASDAVRAYDLLDVFIHADTMSQEVICYRDVNKQ
jgi:hypothetical protein